MVHPAQVQMVQDIAAADIAAPPSRYVQREEDRPTAGAVADIPTIDMNCLDVAKLRAALQTWGLFAVTGHGMPEPFLDEILAATSEFFHLPPEEKEKYSNVVDGADEFQAEGYGIDRVDTDEQILDWCDRLYLQVQPEEERQMQFWPDHPPALRPLLEYTLRSEVFRRVLAAMARALGFNEEFFADKVGERVSTYARLTYYPPCPRPELVYGLKPHTDNSVLTVLLLNKNVGGLQLLKDGRWLDIPVGDERQGEDVGGDVLPAGTAQELVPSDELVGEERPALYKKIKAKDFGDGLWDAFAAGERIIDFLKVKIEQEAAAAAAVSNKY